jgi:lipocalin-like protein
LSEELPKNGDVPKSPLPPIGSLDAVGRLENLLKNRPWCVSRVPSAFAYRHVRDSVAHAPKSFANSPKEHTMNRRATLAMTTTALLCLAVGLSATDSLAQQKSLKEQLVGTWTLVSSDQVRPDGSKLKQFGANPKGINVFDANGRFFLMVASADNSRIAARDPNETNQEEVGGLIAESIAYYGTYTINEEVNVISLHLDASTFPNQIGTDQKRTITSLTADELKYSSPAAISGVQVHQVWKRAE